MKQQTISKTTDTPAHVASEVNPDAPIQYLATSRVRFFICCILSGGLYLIYWLYINWKAVADATKSDIIPILRSYFFGFLFIYPMFMRIRKSLGKFKPDNKALIFWGIMATIIWIIDRILAYWTGKLDEATIEKLGPVTIFVACALTSVFVILTFLPAQKAINEYNAIEFPQRGLKRRFTWGEVVIIVIGFILTYALGLFNTNAEVTESPLANRLSQMSDEQQIAVVGAVGYAYRHIDGYRVVCSDIGYQLTEYPARFQAEMHDELNQLNTFLQQYDASVRSFMQTMFAEDLTPKVYQDIYNELTNVARANNTNLRSACQMFDENAEEIVQYIAGESRPIYQKAFGSNN